MHFREIAQLTHQVFSLEDIINGAFQPGKNDWGKIVEIDNTAEIAKVFKKCKTKMICFADRDNMTDDEVISAERRLEALFEEVFPEKSMFEK